MSLFTQHVERLDKISENADNQLYNDPMKEIWAELAPYLKGETTTPPAITSNNVYYFRSFENIFSHIEEWSSIDAKFLAFLKGSSYWQAGNYTDFFNIIIQWSFREILSEGTQDYFSLILEKLVEHNISADDMVAQMLKEYYYSNILTKSRQETTPTSFGKYLVEMLKTAPNKLAGFINASNYQDYALRFLIQQAEPLIRPYLPQFIVVKTDYYGDKIVTTDLIDELLKVNATENESFAFQFKDQVRAQDKYRIALSLVKYLPEKHQPHLFQYSADYLKDWATELENAYKTRSYYYFHEDSVSKYENQQWYYTFMSVYAINAMWAENPEAARPLIAEFMRTCPNFNTETFEKIANILGSESVDYLILALRSPIAKVKFSNDFYRTLLTQIARFDYSKYEDTFWDIAKNAKNKSLKEVMGVTLGKLGEKAIPKAAAFLTDKKSDVRQMGAFILSFIQHKDATQHLVNLLNIESNDDTRNLILETLEEKLPTTITEAEAKTTIAEAKTRKKLKSIAAEFDKLPPLKWQSSEELTPEEMQFLFYRQSQIKTMKTDLELKPILPLLRDDNKTIWADKILQYFIDKGEDSKLKYLLTFVALFGDDNTIEKLKTRVNKLVEVNRGKMAENIVHALALNSSIKSLRAIEFFSRKYASKQKNIGAAALQAFEIAAKERGITAFELADLIVPNFDFDGLYKSFFIKEKEYRAFIDNQFKLAYLDEDNKKTNTLPKAAAAELKEEFKVIGKEVRDIVKSQSLRMEHYMVTQRRWNPEDWQAFFLNNPIMFVYAIKLIWATFDEDGNLIETFRVTEDLELLNLEGDEIELDDAATVGMIHPLLIDDATKNTWSEQLADDGIEPIFPQLNRPVTYPSEEEKDLVFIRTFIGKAFNGAQLRGKLEKSGWLRGSVVDAGMISSYRKVFHSLGIDAIIEVDGICVGFYEDYDPEFGRLMFVKTNSVKIGSYTYDEPSKEEDERLIKVGNLPAIIYSEVMSDLLPLVVEKETK